MTPQAVIIPGTDIQASHLSHTSLNQLSDGCSPPIDVWLARTPSHKMLGLSPARNALNDLFADLVALQRNRGPNDGHEWPLVREQPHGLWNDPSSEPSPACVDGANHGITPHQNGHTICRPNGHQKLGFSCEDRIRLADTTARRCPQNMVTVDL